MAGIYIHIPFCKQKCSYCDFHFSTDLKYTREMLQVMRQELAFRLHDWEDQGIDTIYFGGGTPSILPAGSIAEFIDFIRKNTAIMANAELTLEANPEDISSEKLDEWREAGINRLSIGIQSFDDALLSSMNRAHNAEQAKTAIWLAKKMGFHAISVDIIFGLPRGGRMSFEEAVAGFLSLEVDHISAYALTIETGTAYHHLVKKGKLDLPDEEEVENQFIYLIDRLALAGYEQYEVSNFAREGHISMHNSSYWKGDPYLGIGPSAHSYDKTTRRWNISNNRRYMNHVMRGEKYWEEESISKVTALNEYVMTRSRTKWGLDLSFLKSEFGMDLLFEHEQILKKYKGRYEVKEGILTLNRRGLLLADRFASDLFQV